MDQQNPYRPPPGETTDSALGEQGKSWDRRAAMAFLPGFAVAAFLSGFYIISNSYGDPFAAYLGLGFLMSPIAIYLVAEALQ